MGKVEWGEVRLTTGMCKGGQGGESEGKKTDKNFFGKPRKNEWMG